MKIYFLGGSFDPPHLGHLKIAEYFSDKCDLFLFIPNKKSPFKKNNPIASISQRFEMLSFLSNIIANSKIETFEIDSKNESFTYLTIEHLMQKYSPQSLNMIIGKDNLFGLKKWKYFDFISKNCNIICMDRDNRSNKTIPSINNISFIDFNEQISSTQIKKLFNLNDFSNLNNLIQKHVLDYILKNNLYT